MRVVIAAFFLVNSFGIATQADELSAKEVSLQVAAEGDNAMDELDPFDPNIEEKLEDIDAAYEKETGLSPYLWQLMAVGGAGCERAKCAVWLRVVKSEQRAYLYLDGQLAQTWKTSTGIAGRSTPNFDTHPNGRIYDSYTSTKYPGGDYKGLGNMPYAVFISGGFAVHGTGQNNWKKLGQVASHGCIRIHPDNAFMFNRLVRAKGIYNVWITVQ
jgi:hypothetical protein